MDTEQSQMTPTDRKVHLIRCGVSVTALAQAIGCATERGNVSAVLHGRRRSDRIEAAICSYLGVDRAVWFPPKPTDSVEQAA